MTTLLHEMHHFDLNFPGSIPSKQDRSPPIQPTLPKSSLVYHTKGEQNTLHDGSASKYL